MKYVNQCCFQPLMGPADIEFAHFHTLFHKIGYIAVDLVDNLGDNHFRLIDLNVSTS